MQLKDKVILITGAGRGAGAMLAKALAQHGAKIAANDISPINVESVVDEINSSGGFARAYVDDVAKKVAVQSMIKNVEDDLGGVDVLINHAAVEPHTPLLNMDEWDWHRVLDVNLTGAFLTTQTTGRMMREKGAGVIINIAAGAGKRSVNEAGAYLASKAGLMELSAQAARELNPHGISVYAVENDESVVQRVLSLLGGA